jgi:hypothetical protein
MKSEDSRFAALSQHHVVKTKTTNDLRKASYYAGTPYYNNSQKPSLSSLSKHQRLY